MGPPDYTFDAKRLATLEGFNILDTPAEPGFDDIVHLAVLICQTPVSLVSFVAEDRQWFKAKIGFEPCKTDLNSSVCAHALVEADLLIIDDLSLDPRTHNNPLVVGEPHIRFYAGAPLRASNDAVLGSLCVIDGKPRPGGLTASQSEGLRNLARQVMSQLELRRALKERDGLLLETRRSELRRNSLLSVGDQLRTLATIPEMTHAAAKITGQTLSLMRAGFGRIDTAGEFIDIEADWVQEGFTSLAGRHRLADYGELGAKLAGAEVVVIDDVAVDPRAASSREPFLELGIRSMANLPVRDQAGGVSLLFAHSDEPRIWANEDLTFLHNVGDRVAASVARAEAEALQRLLNLELSHRMKNTFATVQAIAKQTLRSVPDQSPVEALASRLQALSTANDALLRQNWTASEMVDVVKGSVETMQSLDRFAVRGPPVTLGPRATLSLSLLLHELSTNALKYGALSQPNGRVNIEWKLTGDDLVFVWRESDGPVVEQPTRTGFGSRLISLGLIGTGQATLRYVPSGFEAEFGASLSNLRQA